MRALKIVLRTFSHILSVILCLALMATTLATMLVADVRVAFNKDNIKNVLNELLSAPPRYTAGPISAASTVGPELDLGALLSGEGDLADMLIDYAFEMLEGQDIPIEKEAIEAFVEESTLKEFISDKASSIVTDIVTGENTFTITGDEIQQLVEENKALIEEHFDVVITEEQISEIAQTIDELPVVQEIQKNGVAGILGNSTTAPDGSFDESTGAPAVNNPLAELQNAVAMISNDAVFFALLAACLLLVALLFLLAWNKPYIALLYSGTTVLGTGVLFLVPTLIATTQPATWMGLFSNIPEQGQMIGAVSRVVLMLTGSVCYTVTGLGLALLVGGIVLFIVMKKLKKAKAAKAAATQEAPASPFAETAAELYETAPAAEAAAPAEGAAPAEEAEPAEVPHA